MAKHVLIDYAHIRARLVAYARRRVPPTVAEDLAQEALLLTLQEQRDDPLTYAFGVIKKLISRAAKMSKRALIAEFQQPLPGADEYLDRAENFGRLSAALEQVLVWGDKGKTILTVSAVSNTRIMRTLAEYTASRCAFDELPYTRQHRARLRKQFDLAIADAFNRCQFKIDPNYRQRVLRAEAPPEGAAFTVTRIPLEDGATEQTYEPEDADESIVGPARAHDAGATTLPDEQDETSQQGQLYAYGGETQGQGILAYRIDDPLLSRAFEVVQRFSQIADMAEGLAVAERAVVAAAEKLDW